MKTNFIQYCGKIDYTYYNILKNILCTEVIGFDIDDFDLTP